MFRLDVKVGDSVADVAQNVAEMSPSFFAPESPIYRGFSGFFYQFGTRHLMGGGRSRSGGAPHPPFSRSFSTLFDTFRPFSTFSNATIRCLIRRLPHLVAVQPVAPYGAPLRLRRGAGVPARLRLAVSEAQPLVIALQIVKTVDPCPCVVCGLLCLVGLLIQLPCLL